MILSVKDCISIRTATIYHRSRSSVQSIAIAALWPSDNALLALPNASVQLPENMVFRAPILSDDEQNRLGSENCLVGFCTMTFDSFLKYFSYLSI